MVKNKKLLSILLLFLVSLTAVAATVALNVSVTSDIDSSILNHGESLSGTLTFTSNDTSNHTIDIVASATNSNITFGTIDTITVENSSTNSAGYSVNIAQFTPAGTYTYTVTYNETTDSNSETFSIVVEPDSIITKTIDNDETVLRNSSQDFVLSLNNTGNVQGLITNIAYPTLTLNWNDEVNLTSTGIGDSEINPATGYARDANMSVVGNEVQGISNSVDSRTFTYTTDSSTEYGIYSGVLNYVDEDGVSQSETITMRVYEDSYNAGLEITANFEDITNDDKYTYPGDIIRIEDIEIENNYSPYNDDSIDDIDLEYRVYFISDGDEIVDETYEDSFDIEEDKDSGKFDIEFQVPYDAVQGDYMIELIAIGTIYSDDGTDSRDGEEIVGRYYESFDVDTKSRHMIPKELLVDSYCPGDEAELRIELVNIGENDLDEDDDMFVKIKITEFDYEEWHNLTQDIDVGDVETMTINVDIPSTATIGSHAVEITTKHKSNTNSKLDGSEYTSLINLGSTCSGTASSSTTVLSGQSSEEGTQGMNTKYILTVTNNGDSAVTYDIEVVGVDAWGAAVVSPETVSVPAGGTSTFSVYLQPGNNAQSTNNVVVNLKSGGEVVSSKTLTLTISGISISTLTNSLFGSTFTELGNTSWVTAISLLVVLGTAGGAIWLVHGEQIRSSQNKKRRKSRRRRR